MAIIAVVTGQIYEVMRTTITIRKMKSPQTSTPTKASNQRSLCFLRTKGARVSSTRRDKNKDPGMADNLVGEDALCNYCVGALRSQPSTRSFSTRRRSVPEASVLRLKGKDTREAALGPGFC